MPFVRVRLSSTLPSISRTVGLFSVELAAVFAQPRLWRVIYTPLMTSLCSFDDASLLYLRLYNLERKAQPLSDLPQFVPTPINSLLAMDQSSPKLFELLHPAQTFFCRVLLHVVSEFFKHFIRSIDIFPKARSLQTFVEVRVCSSESFAVLQLALEVSNFLPQIRAYCRKLLCPSNALYGFRDRNSCSNKCHTCTCWIHSATAIDRSASTGLSWRLESYTKVCT